MSNLKIKNPVYSSKDNKTINCDIEHPEYGWIPFTADPLDIEPIGKEIFDACIKGVAGPIKPYVEPIASSEQNKIKAEFYLTKTDWVNNHDVYDTSVTPHLTNREEFILYRSKIRQIAINPVEGDLNWPIEPQAIWSN